MKIAIELNEQNIITDYLYFDNEDYEGFENLTVIDIESEDQIIPYKTKYEKGELSYLDDYCSEYYEQQNSDEQHEQSKRFTKIAVELNNQNIIIGHLYLVSENYDDSLTVVEIENVNDIIDYKTKYENGELIYLDDYAPEYYAQQNVEAQRQQLENQLAELYVWFDEYDNQIKQYERDVRLGAVGTYHIGEILYTIEELDEMASAKAAEITSIRNQIKELE